MEKSSTLNFIKDQTFIVFGEEFARHPHALEHLLRPLFPYNHFLWVQTIGLRSPKFSLYDFYRSIEKIRSWISLTRAKKLKEKKPINVTIINPFMIPFNQFFLVRKFNQWSVQNAVKKILKKKSPSQPISIASVPNACDYVGCFNEKLIIYFCVDEFSLWPGLNQVFVQNLEKTLIEKANIIIATSETLALSKFKKNIPTPIITHGVDFEHFNIGPSKNTQSNKNICYFGLFDERTNQDIILEIATSFLNFNIHIIGKIACDVKKLIHQKNIFFHGPLDYNSLPEKIQEMDIFILPYYKNALTQFINPLKLKEYLSTGRPVIASDLPEVLKLKDFLFIAESPRQFAEIISQLSSAPFIKYNQKNVITYLKENELWEAKTALLSKIIIKNI